ncbi:hypothetical protein [Nocardia thailandica]
MIAVGEEDCLDFGVSVPARVVVALVAERRRPGPLGKVAAEGGALAAVP